MTSDASTTGTATKTGAGPAPPVTGEDAVVVLSPDLLGAIGGLVPGARSALSPLRLSEMPSPEAITALRAHGVLGAMDALAPEWARRLSVLAESRAAARLRVRAREAFECTVYFAPDGGAPVSISRGPAGLLVEDPAPVADLLAGLERLGGSIASPSLDFAVELPGSDALVLAALLDHHRAASLAALARGEEPAADAVGGDSLRAILSGTGVLVGAVREVWGEPLELDDAAPAAERLVAAGQLVESGDGWAASEPGRALAERFMLVDHVADLVALRESDDDTIAWVGTTCLQSGARDVLALERVGDLVRWEVVSPLDLLDWAALLLGDADAMGGDAAPAAEAAPAADAVPVSEAVPAAAWSPTHTVPVGGMPAWASPDPAAAPVATLDPGLPVQVAETAGAWARVVCSNGWEAWVDARRLA